MNTPQNEHYPILLFGISHATVEIAKNLMQRKYEFLIVDSEEKDFEDSRIKGKFPFRIADFQDDNVLQELGIGRGTNLIFSLFDQDYENVFLVLSARNLDPKLKIASITHSHDTIHKLNAAGANQVLDPYLISGKKIYELIKDPLITDVLDTFIFKDSRLLIREVPIGKNSRLDGLMLENLELGTEYNLLVLGIYDRELHRNFISVTEGRQHRIDYEDVLVVIGEEQEIERFKNDYGTKKESF